MEQPLDCIFEPAQRWIFPNPMERKRLIDCLALASFAHTHTLRHGGWRSFSQGVRFPDLGLFLPSPDIARICRIRLETRKNQTRSVASGSRKQLPRALSTAPIQMVVPV